MTVLAANRSTSAVSRAALPHPALLLGILGAVVGFLGSWVPSYWGDEAASVMSAQRSLPSLLAELSTIDGVHGLYYAFLHVWVGAFGSSELSTRLPSAIAVGFAVAGTVVLVRLLTTPRIALLAGAVLIVLPRATSMATEARSYALGTAAAVWVTVLLVYLLRHRTVALAGWVTYGVAMAASVYLFLYLGLLLLVHGVVVAVLFRSRLRSWLRGAAVAVALSVPIAMVGYSERDQIGFLARRNYATAPNVLVEQWFGSIPVAVMCWLLILVALAAVARRRRHRDPLLLLALAWLILPTAILLLGNASVSPMYNVRYLTFSTPAAAILIALGVAAVGRLVAPRLRVAVAAALVILLVALCAPVYAAQRGPFAKDGGSDLRQVAEYMGVNAKTGDAIVFDRTTKPSRNPRLALRLYPASFAAVKDIGLVTPYDDTSGLWDVTAAVSEIDLSSTSSLWVVELGDGTTMPADVLYLQTRGFSVTSSMLIHRTTIYHLIKE